MKTQITNPQLNGSKKQIKDLTFDEKLKKLAKLEFYRDWIIEKLDEIFDKFEEEYNLTFPKVEMSMQEFFDLAEKQRLYMQDNPEIGEKRERILALKYKREDQMRRRIKEIYDSFTVEEHEQLVIS